MVWMKIIHRLEGSTWTNAEAIKEARKRVEKTIDKAEKFKAVIADPPGIVHS